MQKKILKATILLVISIFITLGDNLVFASEPSAGGASQGCGGSFGGGGGFGSASGGGTGGVR